MNIFRFIFQSIRLLSLDQTTNEGHILGLSILKVKKNPNNTHKIEFLSFKFLIHFKPSYKHVLQTGSIMVAVFFYDHVEL